MSILIAGLLLWSVVHFIPSLAPPLKQSWLKVLGEAGYKMSFAVIVVISLGLIVYGWRHTVPSHLYLLPAFVKPIAVILIVLAFILLGMANVKTRIKRVVRHPQLVSANVWASAHLLLNGDSRSVVLFGWMGLWAALEIIMINRREGEWVKPESSTWRQEFKGLAIGLVILLVAATAHPYIAGVPIK